MCTCDLGREFRAEVSIFVETRAPGLSSVYMRGMVTFSLYQSRILIRLLPV